MTGAAKRRVGKKTITLGTTKEISTNIVALELFIFLFYFFLVLLFYHILSTMFIDFPYPCDTNNVTKTSLRLRMREGFFFKKKLETQPQLPPFG